MKTSLKLFCLFSAASVPGLFAAELVGVPLPAGVDAFNAVMVFVVAFVALIAFADYSRPAPHSAARMALATRHARLTAKAAHPLAA